MSKVLFIAFPYVSHIHASLKLVKELVARGEHVVYYSKPWFQSKIESVGAEFKTLNMDFMQEEDNNANSGGLQPRFEPKESSGETDPFAILYDWASGRIKYARSIMDKSLEMIQGEKFDYMIHDSCLFLRELAQIMEIPAMTFIPNSVLGKGAMEIDPGSYFKALMGGHTPPAMDKYDKAYVKRLVELSTLRLKKYFGFEGYDILDVIAGKEELNILFNSKEFQLYPESFDESYRFAGACIYDRDEEFDVGFRRLNTNKPIVYISLGTIFNKNPEFYQNCFKAFENCGFQVVLSVGQNTDIKALGKAPKNFLVRKYVPQLKLLKHTTVFVTHGGTNSVREAVYCGVPMVVVPQSLDQFISADMVEKWGAGIYLKNAEVTVEELKDAVLKVFNEQGYRQRSFEAGETMRATGEEKWAVDEIFKYKQIRQIG